MGFALAGATILGGFYLVAHDKDAQGMAAIIVALAGLVGSFLYARYREGKAAESADREPRKG
ncbi:MAG: hypothetical protein HYT87_10240 [Nitrospirae bacterium]|nr:hypothetical protein [Nitrospirota bacterium]